MSNKASFILWVVTLLLVCISTSIVYLKLIAVLGCLIQIIRYVKLID